jgi:hypothetical protein
MPQHFRSIHHSPRTFLNLLMPHADENHFLIGEGSDRREYFRDCDCVGCNEFFAVGNIGIRHESYTAVSNTPTVPEQRITYHPERNEYTVEIVNGIESAVQTISEQFVAQMPNGVNLWSDTDRGPLTRAMLEEARNRVLNARPLNDLYTVQVNSGISSTGSMNHYIQALTSRIGSQLTIPVNPLFSNVTDTINWTDDIFDVPLEGSKKMITATQMGIRETNKYFIADRYGQKFRSPKGTTPDERAAALNKIKQAIRKERARMARLNSYADAFRIYDRQPNEFYNRYVQTRTKRIRESKAPINRTRHIAAEIEFICGLDKGAMGLLLAKSNVANYLCLKEDGSIQVNDGECECAFCSDGCQGGANCGYDDEDDTNNCECVCANASPDKQYGHELVVCAPAEMFEGVLQTALAIVNGKEAKGKVNKTCGLHIHLDARFSDYHSMYEALTLNQQLLYSMVPQTRKEGRYSKMSKFTSWKEAEVNTDRYQGINPHSWRKYQTIEVRLHSGTTNFNKISRFVRLLQALAYSVPKKLESLDDLFNCGIDPLTSIYVINRLSLFKEDHKDWSWLNGKDLSMLNNVIEQGEVA